MQHVKFADGEIAEMICQLQNELNEFYNMELDHKQKLAEIQATTMQNEIFICNCNLQHLGHFKATISPETPPTRTDTHCSTSSKVRGCAASEGDRDVLKGDKIGSQMSFN